MRVSFGFGESRAESLRLGARGSLAVGGVLGPSAADSSRALARFAARSGSRSRFLTRRVSLRCVPSSSPHRRADASRLSLYLEASADLSRERAEAASPPSAVDAELGDEVVALASQRGERVVRLGERARDTRRARRRSPRPRTGCRARREARRVLRAKRAVDEPSGWPASSSAPPHRRPRRRGPSRIDARRERRGGAARPDVEHPALVVVVQAGVLLGQPFGSGGDGRVKYHAGQPRRLG